MILLVYLACPAYNLTEHTSIQESDWVVVGSSRFVSIHSNNTSVRFASSSLLCGKHCAVYDFKPINSRDEAGVTDVKWLAS